MPELTADGRRIVVDIAARHNLSEDAVLALAAALAVGGGRMAQFSHPELGGMGQWSQGGMIMIGDMFNNALKARVDGACSELALAMGRAAVFEPTRATSAIGEWWPPGLGQPSSAGGQNQQRYAFFPESRRLVIDDTGEMSVYDTGEHRISGVSQQQGGGRSLSFTSQFGDVRLADLMRVDGKVDRTVAEPTEATPEPLRPTPQAAPARPTLDTAARSVPHADHEALFAAIERLAELHGKGILTPEEFTAKKSELLSRL